MPGGRFSHPVDGEEAYRLYTVDHLPYKKIAEKLGVSVGGIRALVGRVRQRKLRESSGFDRLIENLSRPPDAYLNKTRKPKA